LRLSCCNDLNLKISDVVISVVDKDKDKEEEEEEEGD